MRYVFFERIFEKTSFMSMLPEFKCKRGTSVYGQAALGAIGRLQAVCRLYLTTALNCESIRPIFRQVSGFTVAQQPMIFTWFLFNSTALLKGMLT